MKQQKLDTFHTYLQEVVNYWKTNNTLSGYSKFAKHYHVKAITKELFFQYGLDKVEEVSRELSDKIRFDLQRLDRARRYVTPANEQQPSKQQEQSASDGHESVSALFNYVRGIEDMEIPDKEDYEERNKLENDVQTFLGITAMDMQTPVEDFLELKAARTLFKDKYDILPELWVNAPETIKHAILTMLFADEHGFQHKLNYDARGNKSPENEYFIKTLSKKGFLSDLIFARIESWKGGILFFIVYKDAPDILVAYNTDGKIKCHSAETLDFYTYCGDTVIKTEFWGSGGYGTRTNMIAFLDGIRLGRSGALYLQERIEPTLKGRLLYDLLHLNELL